MTRDAFVSRYGALFERSPWIAEAAWEAGPFGSDAEALDAMVAVVRSAPLERRLALIRAHPDLGERAAALTDASAAEQAAAGLDRLDEARRAELIALNDAYRARHGFPFVICAREHDAASIVEALRERLDHDTDEEVGVALSEIARIARLRL